MIGRIDGKISTLRQPPIQLLYAFEAAARHGSFKRAAAELHVTPSAISQQIKTLEDHLGVSLFHRLPRAVRLSEDGAELHRVATDTLDRYRCGMEEFLARREARPLRVSMLPFVAYEVVMGQLHAFRAAHPDVDLRLETAPGLADVAGGDVDAAIRFGRGPWPGLRATPLTDVAAGLVCAPGLLTARGELRARARRDVHLIVVPSFKAEIRPRLEAAGVEGLPEQDLVLDSFLATMFAAERGLGVAVGLYPLVASWIRAGRLASASPARFPLRERYWLVSREDQAERPALTAFRAWIGGVFAEL